MTILDNISLGLQYHENILQEEAYEQVKELLERFGLFQYRFLRPAELTFEQRRLAVYARELVKKPRLFLLEHPSLDFGERVISMLMEIFQACITESGCAFLVASINPEVVSRWGDWVLVLDEGRCKHFDINQFDPAVYLNSMRHNSGHLLKERSKE